jgi:hypothetical protein
MNRISRRPAAEAAESLLEVGRTQPVLHYDVELGLERHHHWLRSDAPMPEWASGGVGTVAKSFVPIVVKAIVSGLVIGTVAVAAWQVRGRPQPSAAMARARATVKRAEHAPAAPPSVPDVSAIPMPVPDPGVLREQPVRRAVRADVSDKRATRKPRAHKEPASARAPAASRVRSAGDERSSGTDARPRLSTPAARVQPAISAITPSSDAARAAGRPANVAPKARAALGPQPEVPDDMVEMQQVATAQQLLERSPQRALALVRQGNQRFAHGYFQQERAYIAIMALIRLGRIDEARTRAASFSKRFPALPYGARIRSALDAVR